jgi:hypothetical protein
MVAFSLDVINGIVFPASKTERLKVNGKNTDSIPAEKDICINGIFYICIIRRRKGNCIAIYDRISGKNRNTAVLLGAKNILTCKLVILVPILVL